MKTKILLILTCAWCLVTGAAFALDLGFAREDGGRPGAFLQYGASARSLGMGKTFVGIADDASSIYWNPAGLALLTDREISTMFANLYEQTNFSFAAYAQPMVYIDEVMNENHNYGTIAAGVVNLSSAGFQLRDGANNSVGTGGISEIAGMVGYARHITRNFALGGTFKLVRQDIDTSAASGYGFDLGFLGALTRNLVVGVSVQNLVPPRLTVREVTNRYPFAATVGFGYKLFQDKLLLAMDTNKTENRNWKFHFGGEYTIARTLALRAGVDETELAAGIGFKWRLYSLDYAFAYHDASNRMDDLGVSHRIGLTLRFKNSFDSE
jgi:hypothetical protein